MALRDTKYGDVWVETSTCTPLLDAQGKAVAFLHPDGRYVGTDGFVVPVGFAEFVERYPDYVKAYAFKHMHRLKGIKYDPDTFEDVASELTLFLFALSPGREAYRQGKRDYIQCFDPILQFGAKKGQFFNYINLIMSNRFSSYVYNELVKDPALNGFHLTWTDGPEGDDSSQESHLVAMVTQPKVTMEDSIISDFHAETLIAKAKEVLPNEAEMIESVLRSVILHDKRSDMASQVGMSKDAFNKVLKRVKKALLSDKLFVQFVPVEEVEACA